MTDSIEPLKSVAPDPLALPRAIARIERLAAVPGCGPVARRLYDRMFESNVDHNLFRGVFASREAAQASAPPARPLGYDNPESAALYLGRTDPEPQDYPAMLWLSNAIARGARRILDVGGHFGMKFYAFRDRIAFPDDLHWTVCDVPAVVRRGRQYAERREPSGRLDFTDDYAALDGRDVLFASGVLQYLPMTLGDWLAATPRGPATVIVNTTPLHPQRAFYTLNSIGTAFCPYRIQHESALVESMAACGYAVRDRWLNPGKHMTIPFHPTDSLASYSGYAFERT